MPEYLKQIGTPFVVLDTTDSTQDFVKNEITRKELKEGAAWFARYQEKGRGQRGHQWVAKKDDNINLTILLRPVFLKITEAFALNTCIALSVYDFFKSHAGVHSSIKWSNDIYWKEKKAGGILIENQIKGKTLTHSVIGIGINLNQKAFPALLPNPVSLRQITNKIYNPEKMARALCPFIENRYEQLKKGAYDTLLREYESCLFHLHQKTLFRDSNSEFEAVILGVQKTGRLLLDRGGRVYEVDFGEIKFVF